MVQGDRLVKRNLQIRDLSRDHHRFIQIKFKTGAPETIKCKVYPMNWAETEFTRNWIQENLASGKIQESQSEITCPSFLIKKKNGTFWMVQDYWPINAWMIPDNLPPPLIWSIVEDLEGMNLFSTFDIWSGYNNVLVKPEDCHWVAIRARSSTEGWQSLQPLSHVATWGGFRSSSPWSSNQSTSSLAQGDIIE